MRYPYPERLSDLRLVQHGIVRSLDFGQKLIAVARLDVAGITALTAYLHGEVTPSFE